MVRNKEPDQLSRDSSAAIAAHMSYGKYKAMQYEAGYRPVIEKKPEGPEPNTICRYCGEGFFNRFKHNKVFCSDECRMKHQSMRMREAHEQAKSLRNV